MPKMSIKKKQPTTIIRNPISRKKLFQFLFKNYIKSAYCGISKYPPPTNTTTNYTTTTLSGASVQTTSSSSSSTPTSPQATTTTPSKHHLSTATSPPPPSSHGGKVFVVSRKELRSEYFNDISECFTESQRSNNRFLLQRRTIMQRNGSVVVPPAARKSSRRNMTVTQPMDNKFGNSDDIGWGKKTNVSLVREPGASFGVCIVGGKVNISKGAHVTGIFIKNVIPGSPADLSKQIKIGDRIISVNDEDVRTSTQEEAINLIKSAGCRIKLVLQNLDDIESESSSTTKAAIRKESVRFDISRNKTVDLPAQKPDTSDEPLTNSDEAQPSTSAAAAASDVKPISVSDDDSDDESDDEETSGKIVTKAGYEIDRKSAGNAKRTKEEIAADTEPENNYGYTDKKLKKKYNQFGGVIIRAVIQRDTNNSMGLALAGHRDRNKMGCFVAGVNPKGSANSQNVQVGDEILEINGVYLHKLCHLNASVIIKGIPGVNLEFILLRIENGLDEIAVKPVLTFPSAFDQFDQLYACFKNVRNVTIQKVGTSLGIMIIEGKHSDVGQGIFISDIQENSNAENAGVKIGEMILAVNKDLLIDTNYDTAAGLLKRAEGIVTLTLCNPNKKEDADASKAADDTSKAAADKTEAKKPEPVPEPEVPKDPATATIATNKETTIELNAENKPLGIIVVKGDSSQVQVGASIIVIHQNGAVHKDGRLKPFDKIIEIDGKKISSETSEDDLKKIFLHLYAKVKMIIYRAEPLDIKEMDVDVNKKSGKDIGLGFAECKENGIYVTEIIPGGVIDLDHRMIKGDIITHINGDDIRKLNFIESSIVLKAAQQKITFKVIRPKGKK